ncbi:MAG: hypothetical protein ACREQ5_11910 [Candidatus Dormibacteria bacterium]
MGRKYDTKICIVCSKPFAPKTSWQKVCLKACRNALAKTPASAYPHLCTNAIGAIGELRVSVDLLAKGYEVFRAVSPSSSCDLIAIKNGRSLRLEVRTGRVYRTTGKMSYTIQPKDAGKSDHYAIVLTDEIVYHPALTGE